MSRPIKFRAWDESVSEFLYFDIDAEYDFYFPEQLVGMWKQFTGLHDKNGREIYEGDILEYITGAPVVVEWVSDEGCFDFSQGADSLRGWHGEYEIIGNKFENPELLEKK